MWDHCHIKDAVQGMDTDSSWSYNQRWIWNFKFMGFGPPPFLFTGFLLYYYGFGTLSRAHVFIHIKWNFQHKFTRSGLKKLLVFCWNRNFYSESATAYNTIDSILHPGGRTCPGRSSGGKNGVSRAVTILDPTGTRPIKVPSQPHKVENLFSHWYNHASTLASQHD